MNATLRFRNFRFTPAASLLCALLAFSLRASDIITATAGGDGSAGDNFGFHVAIDGDTALVGTPSDTYGSTASGSVAVYVRSGITWTLQAKFAPQNRTTGMRFGQSVALVGNTAAIAAPSANGGVGAIYIFTRTGNDWSEATNFAGTDSAVGDSFGSALAMHGTTLIAGAPGRIELIAAEPSIVGAGYVFTGAGANWTQEAKLLASNRADQDLFGFSVALNVDTAIIGAPHANGVIGAAYAFTRSGANWTEQAILTPTGSAPNDGFGSAVAVFGNIAAVGAPNQDINANVDRGSVFTFNRSGNTWTQDQRLLASDPASSDLFGNALSMSADTIVIGAYHKAGNGANQGAAYVFFRSGTWTEQQKLTGSSSTAGDLFGSGVGLSGSTAIVGAPNHTVLGNNAQGAVYAFTRAGAVWTQQQDINAGKGLDQICFGTSVGIDGSTAVSGAPREAGNAGAIYIFVKGATDWSEQAHILAPDFSPNDAFGTAVAVSGDTVVVGAPNFNNGTGKVYVFIRINGTWNLQAQLTPAEITAGDHFGSSVSINGNTLIAGAPNHAVGGRANQGSAYVYFRNVDTWNPQQELTASGGAVGDQFGTSVGVQGNNAVVGAPHAAADRGAAYAFNRNGTTWTQQARLDASTGQPGDQFGFAVAVSGGTAIAGSPYHTTGANTNSGSAFTFVQNGSNWVQEAELTAAPDAKPNDKFGWAVALNNDNAVVGIPFQTIDGVNVSPGLAIFFSRGTGTWLNLQKLIPTEAGNGDQAGVSVSISGTLAICGIPHASPGGAFKKGEAEIFKLPGANSAPVLAAIGNQNIDEGSEITFNASASDPDGNSYVFSLEGAPPGALIDPQTGYFNFTPADGPANVTITIRVTETNGLPTLTDSETFVIHVANVPPAITINGALTAAATVPYTLTVDAPTDVGTDTPTNITIRWGDGQSTVAANPGEFTHSFANGSQAGTPTTISIDITDEDGVFTGVATLAIKVYSAPPSVNVSGNATINEGSEYTLTLSDATDPSGTITGGTIHWGDGTTSPFTGPFGAGTKNYLHTFADGAFNGSQVTITVDLEDQNGIYEGVVSKKITVMNVPPTATISGAGTVLEGASYTLTVNPPVDPGDDLIFGGVINWGDGNTSPYSAPGQYFHTYAAGTGGTFKTIKLDIVDDDSTFTNVASLNVSILNANRPPTASNGSFTVTGTVPHTGKLVGNDPDANTTLTYSITVQPLKGTVTITDVNNGDFTYTANANTTGLDQFKFKVSDGQLSSAAATMLITINRPNANPVVNSAAKATPNPVIAGKPVSFTVTASDPDSDGLTYAWAFGDGATGTGQNVVHTYVSQGTFSAVVTISDGRGGSVTSTVNVTVNPVPPPELLVISKLSIKLNFAKPGMDSVQMSGTLPAITGFNFAGQVINVDVGGIQKTFTLDAKGKSPKGLDLLTLSKPSKGVTKYALKLTKGSFKQALADEGLLDETVKNKPVNIACSMIFNEKTYVKTQAQSYTAKQGKAGATK